MRIQFSPVDHQGRNAFRNALEQLAGFGRIPAKLPIYPYRVPVYRFESTVIQTDKPQIPAAPQIWRYFAGGSAPNATVTGDIALGQTVAVTNLIYGDAAFRTFQALVDLPNLDAADRGTYSVQYLQMPGLLVEMFRLDPVAPPPGAEAKVLLVPFHSLLGNFEKRKSYLDVEAFAEIQRALKRLVLKDDRVIGRPL
jgi:hypothetical protein